MTKAIIFDKDGTLMDFDAFWVAVSKRAILDVLKNFNAEEGLVDEILFSIGVSADGVTDMDGVLCKGTYEEIGRVVYGVLKKHGVNICAESITKSVVKAYNENSDKGEVRATDPELKGTLIRLKNQGVKLAVATTDNEYITRLCLEKLGIKDLFDRVYCDDGVNPNKPNPYYALKFLSEENIDKSCAVMVGDTVTDVKFSQNAGIKVIGVAKNLKNKERLSAYTNTVVDKISDILGVLD